MICFLKCLWSLEEKQYKGKLSRMSDKDNKLLFEIETDQTCFKPLLWALID